MIFINLIILVRHIYKGKVCSIESIGVEILFSNYIFKFLSNNNLNLFQKYNINESLNFKIEFYLDNKNSIAEGTKIFCQFMMYKMNIPFDQKMNIFSDTLNIGIAEEFCIFELVKENDYYCAYVNDSNINLSVNVSGIYLCYFKLVSQALNQKEYLIPQYKYFIDGKTLKPVCSPQFVINITK